MEEIKQSIAEEKGFDNWQIMIKCYSTTDVGLKLIDKCINEVLRLCIVTGSIGRDTKPVLTELERTSENRHITVCDLCIFNKECDYNEKRYHKCCTENTDDQYYL